MVGDGGVHSFNLGEAGKAMGPVPGFEGSDQSRLVGIVVYVIRRVMGLDKAIPQFDSLLL